MVGSHFSGDHRSVSSRWRRSVTSASPVGKEVLRTGGTDLCGVDILVENPTGGKLIARNFPEIEMIFRNLEWAELLRQLPLMVDKLGTARAKRWSDDNMHILRSSPIFAGHPLDGLPDYVDHTAPPAVVNPCNDTTFGVADHHGLAIGMADEQANADLVSYQCIAIGNNMVVADGGIQAVDGVSMNLVSRDEVINTKLFLYHPSVGGDIFRDITYAITDIVLVIGGRAYPAIP